MLLASNFNFVIFFDGYFLFKESFTCVEERGILELDLDSLIARSPDKQNRLILPNTGDCYISSYVLRAAWRLLSFTRGWKISSHLFKGQSWLPLLEDGLKAKLEKDCDALYNSCLTACVFKPEVGVISSNYEITTDLENLSNLITITTKNKVLFPIGDHSRWVVHNAQNDGKNHIESLHALLRIAKDRDDILRILHKLGYCKAARWMSLKEVTGRVNRHFSQEEISSLDLFHVDLATQVASELGIYKHYYACFKKGVS